MTITAKTGEHYWALLDNQLVVVLYHNKGHFDVCGPWECGASEEELTLLQHIPRPPNTADIPLYYDYTLYRDFMLHNPPKPKS